MPDDKGAPPTACTGCGMTHDMWPDDYDGGVVREGDVYCCAGCTDGGCTCERPPLEVKVNA